MNTRQHWVTRGGRFYLSTETASETKVSSQRAAASQKLKRGAVPPLRQASKVPRHGLGITSLRVDKRMKNRNEKTRIYTN